MVRLLILADDFTGALDTGVRFHPQEVLVRIGTLDEAKWDEISEEIRVLVVDTETRHLSAEKAYDVVFRMVALARGKGVPYIYKKTDSALRGNIGSELSAALSASGEKKLHFIPAYPKQGRVTREGVHYVDGVPVAESVFGEDPFEPVKYSRVRDVIQSQSDVAVWETDAGSGITLPDGIVVYDSSSDEELKQIACAFKEREETALFAGCAGFGAMLPDLLQLHTSQGIRPALGQKLFVVCGSVNPVTRKQMDYAEASGALRIQMGLKDKLGQDWILSEEGKDYLKGLEKEIGSFDCTILESASDTDGEDIQEYAARTRCSVEDIRKKVSGNLGMILKQLLVDGLEAVLLLTGGDTLLAFMEAVHLKELSPVCELFPGVVLSKIRFRGKPYHLISKSGGFGGESLIVDLGRMISGETVEKSGKGKE